eukprot:GEMP01012095.1.p1 GENE.GEMP01012095.1~~GEMP01012095.1.p1  ORF type:complete len:509 (+),score=132.30 GEMP01012095.1:99-1625(+)
MKYVSTRGAVKPVGFLDVVLEGLADDGGLYVPEKVPKFTLAQLESWRDLSYTDLCFNIMREFIDPKDITDQELKTIIDDSYANFRNSEISPLVKLHGDIYLLELFHGPTFAFKDVALQFLGTLFSFVLKRLNRKLRVLGATSGDTGSAALYALKDKERVECCILFPQGRTSKTQEMQMTTVRSRNVQCLSVTGTFDDCQSLVKMAFKSPLKQDLSLGAINSINWARILAQTVYYFYAYLRLPRDDKRKITFSVPSGNFGDALAGFYAVQMGLPAQILLGTNSNDILTRFFHTGAYEKFDVMPTISPSMDIQIASNFERFLFHLFDGDSTVVVRMCNEIATKGYCEVSETMLKKANKYFTAQSVSEKETKDTIADVFERCGYVLDPHTAVGYAAAMKAETLDRAVCLATAHFGKFTDSIAQIDNPRLQAFVRANMPEELKRLENLPCRSTTLAPSFSELEIYLRKTYDATRKSFSYNDLHVSRQSTVQYLVGGALTAATLAALVLWKRN